MSTATELRPLSLAERIAKVRGRMLVATLTKVPPSNKELFVALCQVYEQYDMEKASFYRESSDESYLLLQALSSAYEMPSNARDQWSERMLRNSFSQQSKDSNVDNEDGYSDWDKGR